MNLFFWLLLAANLIWSIYLTYLFYRRFWGRQDSVPKTHSQTVGAFKFNLNRYNPFDDVGGDQSFILCLLDNANSGVIITSLHNRDFTRVYAKAIKNGDTDGQKLSKEEIKTLLKTINS